MTSREPLTDAAVGDALSSLSGWTYEGGALRLVHEAADFPAAIKLVDAVAVIAEEANHHPDMDIRWRTVTFTLSTHDAGHKATALDVELAHRIQAAIQVQAAH